MSSNFTFLPLFLSLLLLACQSQHPVSPSLPPAIAPDIHLILNSNQTNATDALKLTVTVINDSNQDIYFVTGNPLTDYKFNFLSPSGAPVPLTSVGKHQITIAGMYHVIVSDAKAHAHSSDIFDLSPSYDLTLPGTYTLSLTRTLHDSQGHPLPLTSNQAHFTIK